MAHEAWRTKHGQSTLEYILVLAAIITAVVLATGTVFKTGLKNMMDNSGQAVTDAAAKLKTQLGTPAAP